jgi:hypothetical protein
LAISSASSKVPTGSTGNTGPKISSWAIAVQGCFSVNTLAWPTWRLVSAWEMLLSDPRPR